MTDLKFDVLGIGNAIADVFAHIESDFLVNENLIKGSMRLIDTEEATRLYGKMGSAVRMSGGSAGNTIAGLASLGGQAAYIGKVADDELGEAYGHDMRGIGAHFATAPLKNSSPTARSMILITPDGERTMNTYLGACTELTPDDIDPQVVGASAITYMEGYLWDPPAAKEAFRRAMRLAHDAGRQTALTLSDSFCVDRYRDEFLGLVKDGSVDILFANEHELRALYQTADLDTAINAVREDAKLAVVTLGEKGSLSVTREETHHVHAAPVDNVVDLTGAGDLFASGFLYGLARDYDLPRCASLGGLAAAEVISHVGARPERSLKDLALQNGFEI
ncbi:adenosine kinase [Breoghania sp. L-A4]|uniref:adenosine kinase n=1 Tax=Breoghania sp. L-A4 TaxID=2304600 RepID=UPI000E35CBCA|nr:adenosine kinase [Breoghania sp. L-A4]AXS39012.1 adenosine kinase [Breoghania sp. L-A4]